MKVCQQLWMFCKTMHNDLTKTAETRPSDRFYVVLQPLSPKILEKPGPIIDEQFQGKWIYLINKNQITGHILEYTGRAAHQEAKIQGIIKSDELISSVLPPGLAILFLRGIWLIYIVLGKECISN